MKMECGGTGRSDGYLTVFRPGEITKTIEQLLDDFLFPIDDFPEEYKRRVEIQISKQYQDRSTIFAYFYGDRLLATCRVIAKTTREEKLPIEAATVSKITDDRFANYFTVGQPFSVSPAFVLPACEVGGLRATADPSVSLRDRYKALAAVLHASEQEAIRRKYSVGFLTCIGSINLQKLYKEKFHFNEIGEVQYGNDVQWKALYRYR